MGRERERGRNPRSVFKFSCANYVNLTEKKGRSGSEREREKWGEGKERKRREEDGR